MASDSDDDLLRLFDNDHFQMEELTRIDQSIGHPEDSNATSMNEIQQECAVSTSHSSVENKPKRATKTASTAKQLKQLQKDLHKLIGEIDFSLPIPETPKNQLHQFFSKLELEQEEQKRQSNSKQKLISTLQKRGISPHLLKQSPKLSLDFPKPPVEAMLSKGKSSIERLNAMLTLKQKEQYAVMQEKRRIKEERLLNQFQPATVVNGRIFDSDDDDNARECETVEGQENNADKDKDYSKREVLDYKITKADDMNISIAPDGEISNIAVDKHNSLLINDKSLQVYNDSNEFANSIDSSIPNSLDLKFTSPPKSDPSQPEDSPNYDSSSQSEYAGNGENESSSESDDSDDDILNNARLLNLISQKFSTPSDQIVSTPKRVGQFFDQEALVEDEHGNIVTETDPEIVGNEDELAREMAESKFIQEKAVSADREEIERMHREIQQQVDEKELNLIYQKVSNSKRTMEFDSMLQKYEQSLVDDEEFDDLAEFDGFSPDQQIDLELDEIDHSTSNETLPSVGGVEGENFKLTFNTDFASFAGDKRTSLRGKRSLFVPRNETAAAAMCGTANDSKRLKTFQVVNN